MSDLFDFDGFVEKSVSSYRGDATALGNALGALVLGRYVGWRALRVIYSKGSYAKYQRLLDIDFKDVLPERGRYSYKSFGLAILDSLGGFWDFVRKTETVPELQSGKRSLFE